MGLFAATGPAALVFFSLFLESSRRFRLQKKKACQISLAGPFETRQRPTFPLPHGSSSIGLGGLNFRVRDGNGCGPSGMATGNIHTEQVFTADQAV